MAYVSIWVRLNEAATRVMDATGCSKEEAQADICRAVYDRAIRFQAKLKQQASGGMTSSSVREGTDFEFRKPIKQADLDWEQSRPLKPWLVGRDKYKPAGFWILDSIELLAVDITSVFCAGGQVIEAELPPTTKANRRPKAEAVRRALQALYPGGVPDRAALLNKDLVWRVREKLKELGLPDVQSDTILREADRRRR